MEETKESSIPSLFATLIISWEKKSFDGTSSRRCAESRRDEKYQHSAFELPDQYFQDVLNEHVFGLHGVHAITEQDDANPVVTITHAI